MDKTNRPTGRKKNVTGESKGVHRRGEGLHSEGPVGNKDGYSDRKEESTEDKGLLGDIVGQAIGGAMGGGSSHSSNQSSFGGGSGMGQIVGTLLEQGAAGALGGGSSHSSNQSSSSGGGMGKWIAIGAAALALFGGGGGLLSNMLSSGISGSHALSSQYSGGSSYSNYANYSSNSSSSSSSGGLGSLLSSLTGGGSSSSSGGSFNGGNNNTGTLNTSVAEGSREKRTVINGNGDDKVTIMVYMCGTDLESNGGMATSDLQEMAAAELSDNVNLIVYTGGCTQWRNSVISNSTNQIYQIKNGGLTRLSDNAGNVSMTSPDTLAGYIQWCAKNFPANRNELIFWDHGGGSISGYGYDLRFPKSGSMSLSGINTALKEGGVKFDFIGFDACLMATLENGLMLSEYADYMIASEETEPGVGWYYTNWLTELSKNTSMPTIEIGQKIADDFVSVCAQKCPGQQTTMSVVDLAELETKAPDTLKNFSQATSKLIKNKDYSTVSNARSKTREFAASNKIDQVDLIDLANKMGTTESKQLAETLTSAVKYNTTSRNMTNAYGLSIYFPYERVSSVDRMVKTYEQIGMDDDYSSCIRAFAGLEASGQAVSGGQSSPLGALLGSLTGSTGSSSAVSGSDMISQLLGSLMSSGGSGRVLGLTDDNSEFLSDISVDSATEYLSKNSLDTNRLVWSTDKDGRKILKLKEKEWDLIQQLELNMFYDDGSGYVDLGLDNVYEFDDDGNLLGENDHTWVAINSQPVAYYFMSESNNGDDSTILGRVPAMLNGVRVDLIISFDSEHPNGTILGARTRYDEAEETETIAKGLTELKDGDKLDFICDYYTYDGDYQDSYYLGDQMTVSGTPEISNVDVGEGEVKATYRITDIYNQTYWMPTM